MLSRVVYQVLANGYTDTTFTFGRFEETIQFQCQITDPDMGSRVYIRVSKEIHKLIYCLGQSDLCFLLEEHK
jgi:hypothetical protein